MNDPALRMQIVQPEQDLFRDLLDDMCRNSSMLVPLDQPQQVLSQHLEHHAYVRPVGSDVPKVIEQLHGVSSSRMVRVGRNELLEELDLIQCGFGVMTIRFDNFERDVLVDPAGASRRRDSDEQVSVDGIRLVQVSHCNAPNLLPCERHYANSRRIPSQPDGTKMAPPQLPHDHISSILERVAYMHWMITPRPIILEILLVLGQDARLC